MFTWLPMFHLPKVPDHFVQQSHDLSKNTNTKDIDNPKIKLDIDQYYNRKLNINGVLLPTRVQQGIDLGSDWCQWVQENIVSEFIETSIRVSVGNSEIHGAHCDFRRKWKLYYLLDSGGDQATTHFYQQKNYPIVREEITNDDTASITVCDYSELTVIDSVQWPLQQWVCLNTMILHGVTGITGARSNLTISIEPNYNLLFTGHK